MNTTTKELVLITGASSGIGYELAKELASRKCDLVLVARSEDKLTQLAQQLKSTYKVEVHVVPCDLSSVEQAARLHDEVTQRNLRVTSLVNNAGVGIYGHFSDTDLTKELDMITVNVTSLVTLTKLFVQDMLIAKQGRIMNVASLLSFLPFPYYTVYSATKAFVLAFSETLAEELADSGVVVTTLCPGPVDTGFNTDDMWRTNAYKVNKPVSATVVAREGADLLLKGEGRRIVGLNNRIVASLPAITPHRLLMKIKKTLASPSN